MIFLPCPSQVDQFQTPSTTAGGSAQEVHAEKKTSLDSSLKVITATIQGMKHWNQYKDKSHLMFEVIGTASSGAYCIYD